MPVLYGGCLWRSLASSVIWEAIYREKVVYTVRHEDHAQDDQAED